MLRQRCLWKAGCMTAFLLSSVIDPAFARSVDYLDLPPEVLLEAEVMSASKRREKLFDTPSAIYVISSEDIMRSGVTNIPDALRMAPGVQVAQTDSNSWVISIRGFNDSLSNKLLVMIDGRTVYNPIFGGTYWEAQDVVLADIDRIEVVRGPGGTLWGANAVNGVINIITRNAAETQGALVSGIYGTHERVLTGRQGGVIGNEGFYRVYAKHFDRDSFDRPSGQEGIDDWDSYRAGFRTDWNNQFTLQGDIYRTKTQQITAAHSLVAPFRINQEVALRYTGANILGRWSKDFDDDSLLTFQSYIDYSQRNEPLLLKDERVIFDSEVQYNLSQMGRHALITGAGFRYTADEEGNTRNASFDPASNTDSIYNVFVQDKITLIPENWYLTLGTKLEYNDFSGFEIQPNARLQWLIDDQKMAWAAVSRAVRTPTRLEHDVDITASTSAGLRLAVVGNDAFGPEELTAYEIGYRNQITPALSVDATVFYNDYEDLAAIRGLTGIAVNNGIDPVHLLLPFDFTNGVTAEMYGAELSANWNVTEDWALSANYSFIDVFLHAQETGLFEPEAAEGGTPHNQFNIRSAWNVNDNWSLNTTLHYVDEIDRYDVGDYVRLDMNVNWKISEHVDFTLAGQNLLDDSRREFGAADSLNVTEPERAFFGKITWQF